MSAEPHEIVSLCLSTADSVVFDEFVKGLKAQGLDNPVHHFTSGAEALAFVSTQSGAKPILVLFDIRAPNSDARNFLADVTSRGGNNPPVVIIIADDDDELANLSAYRQIIAGRISPTNPAEDFLKLVEMVLASNWTLETINDTQPGSKDD